MLFFQQEDRALTDHHEVKVVTVRTAEFAASDHLPASGQFLREGLGGPLLPWSLEITHDSQFSHVHTS